MPSELTAGADRPCPSQLENMTSQTTTCQVGQARIRDPRFEKPGRFRGCIIPDGMRRPVSAGCDTLPMIDALKAQLKGDRLCQRLAPWRPSRSDIFKGQQLTIGLDLGDRSSYY